MAVDSSMDAEAVPPVARKVALPSAAAEPADASTLSAYGTNEQRIAWRALVSTLLQPQPTHRSTPRWLRSTASGR
jgi:hypothetical protein